MSGPDNKLLTPAEVAARWGMAEHEVTRLAVAGRLKALWIGGELLRFHPDAVAVRPALDGAPPRRPTADLVSWRERALDFVYRHDFYLAAAFLTGLMIAFVVAVQQ